MSTKPPAHLIPPPAGAPSALPYLGQRVLFNDPYLPQAPGQRQPRFALVSGLGERPSVVHLTVFNHPEDDCHAQGMAPVQARRRVEFVARGRPLPGPTVCYCTPADDLVPAGSAVPAGNANTAEARSAAVKATRALRMDAQSGAAKRRDTGVLGSKIKPRGGPRAA